MAMIMAMMKKNVKLGINEYLMSPNTPHTDSSAPSDTDKEAETWRKSEGSRSERENIREREDQRGKKT